MDLKTLGKLMADGLKTNRLRTNDVLRKDEWINLDQAIIDVARQELVAINDLRSLGLTRNLGGLGTTVAEWEKNSDMTDADVTMDAATLGEEDTVDFSLEGVPVPLFIKAYRLSLRRLEASRRRGQPLDVTQAMVAGKKVAQQMEAVLFNGRTGIKADSRTLYGYTNYPTRNQVNIAGSWDTTPANITADCELMLTAADASFYKGPFILYVPAAFWSKLRSQENSYKQSTYLERIKQYAEISNVRWGYPLAAGNVVMVQATRDVIEWGVGKDISNIEWDAQGGLVMRNVVMAAGAPICKSDDNGNCGILHGT
jgi:uncharacterized linocin/CFP29 family protein